VNKLIREFGGDGAFDPEAVTVLVAAFDGAWKLLQGSGVVFASEASAENARLTIAKRIIEMARQGEHEQRRLRNDALTHFAKSNLRNAPRRGNP
jgi:hypothetical protein